VSVQYEISTTVEILVYVRDGEITGIDVVDGFGEPYVEAVDLDIDTDVHRVVHADNISDWKTTELAQALAPLTGRWKVEALP
jgi:hypothetical protein